MFWTKRKTFAISGENQNGEIPTAKKKTFLIFRGLLLGGISGAFFASAALLVKYITNVSTDQLALYRFAATLCFSLPEAVKYRGNIFGPTSVRIRLIIFIRSLCAASHVLLSFVTFRYLPLGEASVIILSVPAFVALAARIFLKEPCGIFQSFIVALTITGVCFTAKLPSFLSGASMTYSKEDIYGLLAGIGSIIFNTSQIVLIRSLKDVHYAVLMLHLAWIALIEIIVVVFLTGNLKWHSCGSEALFIILFALFSYLSQYLVTLAIQGEFAAPVATIRSSVDILMSFVFQTLVFQVVPDSSSFIGASFLGSSFILNGLKTWVSGLSDDSTHMKYLKCLLM